MNFRTTAFALCFLLIGVLATLAFKPAWPNGQAQANELQALSLRLDRLESRSTEDQGKAIAQAVAVPEGTTSAPARWTPETLPDTTSGAEAAIRSTHRAAELEAGFSAEKRVPAWAASAEKHLSDSAQSDLLAQANLVPDLFQTVCKASRCRVRARFSSANAAEEWANLYIMGTAGTLSQAQIIQTPLADGRSELTIYGMR